MQATGTLRTTGQSKGALWLIALIAGMLLAGAGGYLAHGMGNPAGASSHVQATDAAMGEASNDEQPTAAPTANEPQFDGGLQR